jgi:hypothetical protein
VGERGKGKEYHLGMAASSTVVEHLAHNPKIGGKNSATGTWKKKIAKK